VLSERCCRQVDSRNLVRITDRVSMKLPASSRYRYAPLGNATSVLILRSSARLVHHGDLILETVIPCPRRALDTYSVVDFVTDRPMPDGL
jgi:hypothetical protein